MSVSLPIRIALDAMGGDKGYSVVIPAAIQTLKMYPELELILVGDENIIQKYIHDKFPDKSSRRPDFNRLIIHHASQQVEMDESPALALRTKKDSSMRVAIDLVKKNQAHACVSGGNTGALMAIARFVLKTLPGIDRPAIMAIIPNTGQQSVRVLDLGANVDSKPEHLFQFAMMGTILARAVDNIERPTTGLLNIGQEDIKGNELVKQTAKLLQNNNSALNYIGYIEADEVFTGKANIIVCDGFVGNIALKSSEGMSRLISYYIKESFQQNLLTKIAGLFARPVLNNLKKRIDPSRYNGASLVGLQGAVIKSHGSSNKLGFIHAIKEAILEVQQDIPTRIRNEMTKFLLSTGELNPNSNPNSNSNSKAYSEAEFDAERISNLL